MYIHPPARITLLLMITLCGYTTASFSQERSCLEQNDHLIKSVSPAKPLEAQLLNWLSLLEECPSEPHVWHNLGVVSAKLDDWDSAANYFKKSLKNEPRADHSYQHLNRIYRHQAVSAYRNVLQSNKSAPKKPAFNYQLSTLQNSPKPAVKSVKSMSAAQSSLIRAVLEDWLQENLLSGIEPGLPAKADFLLVTDSQKPVAVVHTDQRSYVLEFAESEGKWHIFKERSIP